MTDPRKGFTSASSASFDLACPGRHWAQKGFPELPKSEEAESGTRIHAWLANITNDVVLSPEEMEVAEACRTRKAEILGEWMKPDSSAYGHVEERLWASYSGFKHSGQADFVSIQHSRALCLDFKTGRNDVAEPNTNQQLRDLAVLIYKNYEEVEEVTVAIVQPFAKKQPPCVYDKRDLRASEAELRNRIKLSNNPLSPRIPGEKQCRWCRAKIRCPEYQQWTQQALPIIASGDLGIQKPWTLEQWVQFLTIAPEAESWIEAKRSEAKRLLEADPDSIPGYELRASEREKVANVQAVFEQATARGVKQEDFLAAVSVTKKGLKEALRSTGLAGKELQNSMEEILFGNVETKATEPSIVKKKSPA